MEWNERAVKAFDFAVTHIRNALFPENARNEWLKWLLFVVELVHMFLAFTVTIIGILLPKRLLMWNMLFLLLIVAGWRIFGGCVCTSWVQRLCLASPPTYRVRGPLPIRRRMLMKIIYANVLLTLVFYTFPQISPFRIFRCCIDWVGDKYDECR